MRVGKIVALLTLVITVIWFSGWLDMLSTQQHPADDFVAFETDNLSSAHANNTSLVPSPSLERNISTTVNDDLEFNQSASARDMAYFEEQAHQFRTLLVQRPGNLQQWLDRLWQLCRDLAQPRCQNELLGLSNQLTTAELTELKALLALYHRYQGELIELQLSNNLSLRERVETIRQLRESYFSEFTEIMFGAEHQFADYQIAVDALQTSSQQLAVPERLEQLNKLQKKFVASYSDLFGPEQAYQQSLSLIDDLPESEKHHWQTLLRQQFFGDDADMVAAFEQQQDNLALQRENYQQELAELERQYAALKPKLASEQWLKQYNEALTELRIRHFVK